MIKKKLRSIIGLAIATSLAMNSLTYATVSVSKEGINNTNIYNTLGENLMKAPEDLKDDFKISKSIDTTSEEVISVIVEFVSEPIRAKGMASPFSNNSAKVERDHRVFEEFLTKMPSTYSNSEIEIKESYSVVYNGVALDIKANEVERLLKCGVVKRIHEDYNVSIENPTTLNNESRVLDTKQVEPFMMDSLPFLDIDDLHNENIKGEGIKVGVLDTGVDYNHPDLTDAYKGFREIDGDPTLQDENSVKGWDFVDGDADPMETTYEDWLESGAPEFDSIGNPYYTSHGTHVSGTISGQGVNTEIENPVLGVAPDVDLYGYRVLGPNGSGATSAIIAGIEKSVKDGMDVINLSLGNSGVNHPFDPMVEAVNNATLAGVVTVIAAGNAGPNAGTIGSPGTAQLPITVGASDVDFGYDTYDITLGDITIEAEVMSKDLENSFNSVNGKEFDAVYCGIGDISDFEGKDLTGKVAVIDRGTLSLIKKVENAKNAGAAFAIMINNVEDQKIPYLGESVGSNTLAISLKDGEKLKSQINSKLSISLSGNVLVEGDSITSFSSAGPVGKTAEIRPDIVAPGSQVFSTVPEYINDKNVDKDNYNLAYQRMSGTSMATPHVAGIAALILQANPEYTPEQIKAAIMNTSENIHQKDGKDYSVHQAGAGRVNPYKAVHEDVSFTATYKTAAGVLEEEITNTTGMLSYGKLYSVENEAVEKTIPVTVTNNSDSDKTYNVTVEYSNNERATDAIANNVKLQVVDTITVKAGESKSFDSKLILPANIQKGIYEGYIHFVEVGNEANDYQMPFSASFQKEGITSLYYPALQDGYAQGISAFNTSALFDKSGATYYTRADIEFAVSFSESVKTIEMYIKDSNTGEYLGLAGKEDGSWIPEEADVLISNVLPSGKVKKIVNGNISHEEIPLDNGVYDLEVVAITAAGKEFKSDIPVCIINDTAKDKVDFNFTPGIIEVSDEMFTYETWFDGKEHEGIWIKGNVYNEYVDEMKKQYGLDYLKQDELNAFFPVGIYPNGEKTFFGTMSKGDGNILVAGVEKEDLKDGFFRVEMEYCNAGTIAKRPYNFIFVDPKTEYLSLDIKEDKVSEGDTMTSEIKLKSSEDITEGKFVINSFGDAELEIIEINPTKELKEILDKNSNSIEINFETSTEGYNSNNFEVSFKITGDNVLGLNGDIKLFDIKYKVKSLRGVSEKLLDDSQYKYNTVSGVNGEFKNSKGETVNIKVGTMADNVSVESKERTLIYGTTSTPVARMRECEIYAVDPDGNRYEPTHLKFDEMLERGYGFTFNNLPVIDGNYQVIVETPGSFNNVMNVPGSRINEDGERIGNIFAITNYTFTSPNPLVPYLGDVNGDGAIDVVDAMEIAKVYEAEIPETLSEDTMVTDLTQDGKVNSWDMEMLLSNYLMQDFTRDDSKSPQESVNGYDIHDVLEMCGYYDEIPEMNVELQIDKDSSIVGEEVTLTAIPPIDGIDFKYEFSVREENDSEWTVIKEKGTEAITAWTPKKDGKYAVKVRIFLDEINYVWQDNKLHTVNPKPVEPPVEPPVDPEEPGNPGDPNDPNKPGEPTNPEVPEIPVEPEDGGQTSGGGKLPQTGAAVGTIGILTVAGALITAGEAIRRKNKK